MGRRRTAASVAKGPHAEDARAGRIGSGAYWRAGVVVFALVAAFYFWTATSSQSGVAGRTRQVDHYNLLAEGFLAGHLYLVQGPPKEMLALPDPLDPKLNGPYRLHDASLYQGRYYLYFGPVPVLTLYLPWRIFTGSGMPTYLAVTLYLIAGYVFSCLLLFLLLERAGIRLSWAMASVAIAALGLCQTAPVLLRRTDTYETAVASAFCFFMAGVYFLARYLTEEKRVAWHGILGGLFLGLTPGCRPNYALTALIVVGGSLLYLWQSRQADRRVTIREISWIGLPFALCGILLVWYNYARFGSLLETGQTYQLIGNLADRGIPAHPAGWAGLYKFLVETPLHAWRFPFFELAGKGRFGAIELPKGMDYSEPIAGLLVSSPLTIVGFPFPFFAYRYRTKIPRAILTLLALLFVSAMATLISIVMTVYRVTQRYELDFAPSLLILSLFVLLWLQQVWQKRAIAAVMIAGVLSGATLQAAYSINGYREGLMWTNPAAFRKLASFFGSDARSVPGFVSSLSIEGQIRFQPQAPGTREALLTTGIYGRSNAIFFETLGNGNVRCHYLVSGSAVISGPEIPVTPNRTYPFAIGYAWSQEKMVLLLGDTAWEIHPTVLIPTAVEEATIGRNETGELPGVRAFSGSLSVPNGVRLTMAE